MRITIPDLTGRECGEIAVTAAEGGIGYWAQIDEYRPLRWMDGTCGRCQHPAASHKGDENCSECSCTWLDATPIDAPDDYVFYRIAPLLSDMGPFDWDHAQDVTPAWIRQGFERCYEAPMDEGGWGVRTLIATTDRIDWTGEIDSDVADLIFQFAAFGKVVYG